MIIETFYRDAAEIVFVSSEQSWRDHIPACNAIYRASNNHSYSLYHISINAFNTAFKPKNLSVANFWFGDIYNNKKNANTRIFALLLMAEMAKDQGL